MDSNQTISLILYSKPDCHLCEGLEEKLRQIKNLNLNLEIRDITTRDEWFNLYQYEIPVLCYNKHGQEMTLPRLSPRVSVAKIEQMLEKYVKQANAD